MEEELTHCVFTCTCNTLIMTDTLYLGVHPLRPAVGLNVFTRLIVDDKLHWGVHSLRPSSRLNVPIRLIVDVTLPWDIHPLRPSFRSTVYDTLSLEPPKWKPTRNYTDVNLSGRLVKPDVEEENTCGWDLLLRALPQMGVYRIGEECWNNIIQYTFWDRWSWNYTRQHTYSGSRILKSYYAIYLLRIKNPEIIPGSIPNQDVWYWNHTR